MNGHLQATTNHPGSMSFGARTFDIGDFQYLANLAYWKGEIDEIWVWKRILSDDEIGELYITLSTTDHTTTEGDSTPGWTVYSLLLIIGVLTLLKRKNKQ